MTWTATLGRTEVTPDNRYITDVRLTDGSVTTTQRLFHSGTTASLRASVVQWTQGYDARSIATAALPSGASFDIAEPNVIPDPAKIAFQSFMDDWQMFLSASRGLSAGLPINASQVSALQASLVSSYRTAYVRFL